MDSAYPNGREEVRTFLGRLIPIRNCLSHSNPISVRQAEQCVCYCNDFIDCVKLYFEKKGKEKMWNVPSITKINDSLGNEVLFKNLKNPEVFLTNKVFYVGESYTVWLTLDSAFNSSEYTIKGNLDNRSLTMSNNQIIVTFTEQDVSQEVFITLEVISNKTWHKYHYSDQRILIVLEVRPVI